mgnify:CR=1 FL=1
MNSIGLEEWSEKKKYVTVKGKKMAYVEMGEGRPILFQHGNPTSSYLWRNIMPGLAKHGRCIAIDLIGMGHSEKLSDSDSGSYSFSQHEEYWKGALETLDIKDDIVLVIHDWGSALGFKFMTESPDLVAGVCYMEAIVNAMTWADWPEDAAKIFKLFRSEAGEEIILQKNVFVEKVLPSAVMRELSVEEMEVYREPFKDEGEDRRPTLSWPRQIPISNEPKEMCLVAENYAMKMATSEIPKLFINAEPGNILRGRLREFARTWKNQTEVTVKGLHFIQEDSPQEITKALDNWLVTL